MTAWHAFFLGLAIGAAVATYAGFRWGKSIAASKAGVTLSKDIGGG